VLNGDDERIARALQDFSSERTKTTAPSKSILAPALRWLRSNVLDRLVDVANDEDVAFTDRRAGKPAWPSISCRCHDLVTIAGKRTRHGGVGDSSVAGRVRGTRPMPLYKVCRSLTELMKGVCRQRRGGVCQGTARIPCRRTGVLHAGQVGDPEQLLHLARRWKGVYEDCLDWAARLGGARAPREYLECLDLLARYVDAPVRSYREFLNNFIEELDRLPAALSAGNVRISMILNWNIPTEVSSSFAAEIQRLNKSASMSRRPGADGSENPK
jgi:hypothetical protein